MVVKSIVLSLSQSLKQPIWFTSTRCWAWKDNLAFSNFEKSVAKSSYLILLYSDSKSSTTQDHEPQPQLGPMPNKTHYDMNIFKHLFVLLSLPQLSLGKVIIPPMLLTKKHQKSIISTYMKRYRSLSFGWPKPSLSSGNRVCFSSMDLKLII